MKRKSDTTFIQFGNWVHTFTDYSSREKEQLKEGFIYTNEIENLVGAECYYRIANRQENNKQRDFVILLLKDKTLLFHASQHYNGSDALQMDSMRVPNRGDVEIMEGLIMAWETLLQEKELAYEKEQRKIDEEKDELFSFFNKFLSADSKKEIKQLKTKLFFCTTAIKEASDVVVEAYKEGDAIASLYYSPAEIEKHEQTKLKDRLHMVWQRRAILSLGSKRSSLKEEVCPACLNERDVLENLWGLHNVHLAKKRICHFCWGEEQHPLNEYLSMNEMQFKQHLETMLAEKGIRFRIWKDSLSRSSLKVYTISFHSQYDMMPMVSEVYNMIFAVLATKNQYTGTNYEGIEKTLAAILNSFRNPHSRHNRITFITNIFPLFNDGFVSLPEFDEEQYSLTELVSKYEESEKILVLLDHIYDALTEPILRNWNANSEVLRKRFNQISKDLVEGYEETYQMTDTLLKVLHYMVYTEPEWEDYRDTDLLTIKEVIKFLKVQEDSSFKDQKITETQVRNWIKKGELIAIKRGKYLIQKGNLLEFFNKNQ